MLCILKAYNILKIITMFQVSIKIKSIKTQKGILEKPRFYLKMGHFHYFISDLIRLQEEQAQVNIEHKFYLPQDQPQFELMLLLEQGLKSKRILGQSCLDVRQWPINEQKSRIVQFSQAISVVISIHNSYIAAILSPQGSENSLIDQMQSMQIQLQIKENHGFLQAKNQKLQQQLQQLSERYIQLQSQQQKKEKMIEQRKLERQVELLSKSREVIAVKKELQHINIQIGAIINLVNDHGQIEICNSILDFLASKSSNEP